MRRDWMNTNTWFNEHRNVDATGKAADKPVLKQYQPGGRVGGPIIRDKAFFFVNYELVRTPGMRGDTRTIRLTSRNAQLPTPKPVGVGSCRPGS